MGTILTVKIIGVIVFLLHYHYRMDQLKRGLVERNKDIKANKAEIMKLNERITDLESIFRKPGIVDPNPLKTAQRIRACKSEAHEKWLEFKRDQDIKFYGPAESKEMWDAVKPKINGINPAPIVTSSDSDLKKSWVEQEAKGQENIESKNLNNE